MEHSVKQRALPYRFPSAKLRARRTDLPPAVLVEAGSFSPITNMHLRVSYRRLAHCSDTDTDVRWVCSCAG